MTASELPPVEDLLPHAAPMVVLERVVRFGDGSVDCAATVRAERLPRAGLASDRADAVPAWVTIEHMAQAVGAYAGLVAREEGEPVRIGFLLGTRRLVLHRAELRDGQRLGVRARCEWHEGEVGRFECSVCDADTGEPIAEGRLSVYRPRDVDRVLR